MYTAVVVNVVYVVAHDAYLPVACYRWFRGLVIGAAGFYWLRGLSLLGGRGSRGHRSGGSSIGASPVSPIIPPLWASVSR